MRKVLRSISILLLGFIAVTSLAQAERIEIESKVIEVNSLFGYLKVDLLNPSGETKEIKINIERGTLYEIYQSIQDVKSGDDVAIDADFNAFTREWKAIVIRPRNQADALKIVQALAVDVSSGAEDKPDISLINKE